MKKELKEMTAEELLEDIKAASNQELYGNIDEPEEDKESKKLLEEHKIRAKVDFDKFTRLIRKQKKFDKELLELETMFKDNVELQKYIKLLNDKKKVEADIDNAKKGYLYESTILVPDMEFENEDVKLTVVQPYEKEDFDRATFVKDFGPSTDMYKKYMIKKQVKGSVKFKIKN